MEILFKVIQWENSIFFNLVVIQASAQSSENINWDDM